MKRLPWPTRVMAKYFLLQVPTWVFLVLVLAVLRKWIGFPWWVIPAAVALWVIKDAVLFPFVWPAYDSGRQDPRPLVGARGVVVRSLSPEGYIHIDGEFWRAEAMRKGTAIAAGEIVQVQEIRGLTLLVRPVKNSLNLPEIAPPKGGIFH